MNESEPKIEISKPRQKAVAEIVLQVSASIHTTDAISNKTPKRNY
jgi:hypothetical protein